jgi:GNAT superfamily N-acetyltransferase
METAFFGNDISHYFDDREMAADIYCSYYTDYEPQSLFVAEKEGEVVGYLMGATNTGRYKIFMTSRIVPRFIPPFLFSARFFNKTNLRFIWEMAKAWLSGQFPRDTTSKGYPSHFHLNILPKHRAKGLGMALVKRFEEELRWMKIPGLFFHSVRFRPQFTLFDRDGYSKLRCKPVSFWKYWTGKNHYFLTYGKKL